VETLLGNAFLVNELEQDKARLELFNQTLERRVDERARELLTLVQLDHRLTHLPDELSGGERQRVAIARALSIYPPILLADEPTGNLDTRTGAEILTLLHDVHDRLGSTVVIVTHDMQVAARCGRTIALRDGHVEQDTRR